MGKKSLGGMKKKGCISEGEEKGGGNRIICGGENRIEEKRGTGRGWGGTENREPGRAATRGK